MESWSVDGDEPAAKLKETDHKKRIAAKERTERKKPNRR
jgi:hypothetical protein